MNINVIVIIVVIVVAAATDFRVTTVISNDNNYDPAITTSAEWPVTKLAVSSAILVGKN